ncbi:hypothetical protein AB1Y20_014864 [Prymnesium parvum]|uniref:Uncharacterized protein n=1 Tax=Prymnesium parvum TaxID=97485 RepID=A0AB34JZ06_PRYPA
MALQALVAALQSLEGQPPAEQAAFFTAALDASAADEPRAPPATRAAHAVFRHAAANDLDGAALEAALRREGLGEACAAAAALCWATHGDAARWALLHRALRIDRLVDLDWKFGGEHTPLVC